MRKYVKWKSFKQLKMYLEYCFNVTQVKLNEELFEFDNHRIFFKLNYLLNGCIRCQLKMNKDHKLACRLSTFKRCKRHIDRPAHDGGALKSAIRKKRWQVTSQFSRNTPISAKSDTQKIGFFLLHLFGRERVLTMTSLWWAPPPCAARRRATPLLTPEFLTFN